MRLAPKKNTMAALDAVKADLLHSEDEIAQLMRERQSAIADGNDDRAIACEEREAKVRRRRELLRDRIALLQETLGQEIIDRRQQGHARAVSGVTKRIAALSVFDAELANAITVVANTLEAKSIAMKMLLQEWPQACERPLVSQIGLTNASDSIA